MVMKLEKFRLLPYTVNDAFTNMATDEAILMAVAEGKSIPTLRFYRWLPSAISIGIFQSMHDEVDVERCKSMGVDVIRRITGGGAVYHDSDGEVTYSIAIPIGHRLAPSDILESYRLICNGIVEGLKDLGISAKFSPINDVTVNDRKISGNAQTRRHGVLLQHGTILVDFDPEVMFSLLKVPNEKIRDKKIKAVRRRVTSIRNELGRKIELDKVADIMRHAFERALNIELNESDLTEYELKLAEQIKNKRYKNPEWNFKR